MRMDKVRVQFIPSRLIAAFFRESRSMGLAVLEKYFAKLGYIVKITQENLTMGSCSNAIELYLMVESSTQINAIKKMVENIAATYADEASRTTIKTFRYSDDGLVRISQEWR